MDYLKRHNLWYNILYLFAYKCKEGSGNHGYVSKKKNEARKEKKLKSKWVWQNSSQLG